MTTLKQLKEDLKANGYSEKEALELALETLKAQQSKSVPAIKKSSAVATVPAVAVVGIWKALTK